MGTSPIENAEGENAEGENEDGEDNDAQQEGKSAASESAADAEDGEEVESDSVSEPSDEMSDTIQWSCRGSGDSMRAHGEPTPHGKPPAVGTREAQLDAREGQARRYGVAERPVVVLKPGNAGGAKGP